MGKTESESSYLERLLLSLVSPLQHVGGLSLEPCLCSEGNSALRCTYSFGKQVRGLLEGSSVLLT